MAKEIREIIAMEEQLAAGNQARLAGLKRLRVDVDFAEAEGFLDPSLPQEAAVKKPQAPHVEGLILPTKDQLVTSEREALSRFFGKNITVPEPPIDLFTTVDQNRGVRRFEAHYLPGITLKENDKFPGWQVKPEKWFWQKVKDGSIEKGATSLHEGWYLVDGRGKPNYSGGKQRYKDDAQLQAIMDDLRAEGKIQVVGSVPTDSRFGASPDEIEQVILPEFARLFVPQGEVRNKRYIEFNVWGNMFHPEWGNTNTWEWFADKFEDDNRLIGGYSGSGGLAYVDYFWSDIRNDNTGFSPVVAFSSKPQ